MDDSYSPPRWFSTEQATEMQWPNVLCPCCGSPPMHGYNQWSDSEPIGVCSLEICPVMTWVPTTDTPSWWFVQSKQSRRT